MNNIIQEHKEYLISCIKGFDSSLKSKGVTLYGIIQDIDRDSSISESTVKRKFDMFYNKTVLVLRRLNNKSKLSWLSGNASTILVYLYVYRGLTQNVYKVDDDLISWYRSNHVEDGTDLKLLKENDLGYFVFCYKDLLYTAEICDDKTSNRYVSICNLWKPSLRERFDSSAHYISYKLEYETFQHEETEFFHHSCDLSVMCNNTKCPRWSQSLSAGYKDGAKSVSCDLEDCEKCKTFEECGVLKPKDALTIVKAIYECMLTREYGSNRDSNKQDYEHIPLPQRVDDVIVYFGVPKRTNAVHNKTEDSNIVSSHASPREHHRRGGTRRAYTRKDGVEVRATTFKETTVNKGHTKTTYILKERK